MIFQKNHVFFKKPTVSVIRAVWILYLLLFKSIFMNIEFIVKRKYLLKQTGIKQFFCVSLHKTSKIQSKHIALCIL